MFDEINSTHIILAMLIVGAIVYSIIEAKKYIKDNSVFLFRKDIKSREEIKKEIENMDGFEFEMFVASVFRKMGYKAEVTKATGDEGRDIIIYGYKGKEETYVECKRYGDGNVVGSEIVNKLLGSCVAHDVKSAIIVTTSTYTKSALEIRNKVNWIEFWYLDDLLNCIMESEIKQIVDSKQTV